MASLALMILGGKLLNLPRALMYIIVVNLKGKYE